MGSPAIDRWTQGSALTGDQRGVPRPIGAADAGAFERVDFGTAIGCLATPNSTGAPSSLDLRGTDDAAANVLRLEVRQLPSGTLGYFLVGTQQGFAPNAGGSQGNLCALGTVGRLNRFEFGEVRTADAAGRVGLDVDLTNFPTPTGAAAVLAGDTRVFQYWHRDAAPTSTSNFSSAALVTFR